MTAHINCVACRDSGWVSFTRVLKGTRFPWAAACLCEKGMYLSSPREWTKTDLKNGAYGSPIQVQSVDREVYNDRGGR